MWCRNEKMSSGLQPEEAGARVHQFLSDVGLDLCRHRPEGIHVCVFTDSMCYAFYYTHSHVMISTFQSVVYYVYI